MITIAMIVCSARQAMMSQLIFQELEVLLLILRAFLAREDFLYVLIN